MKKNIILVSLVGIITAILVVVALKHPVNEAYDIKNAGYTYSPKGEVVHFSDKAKYNNTWINHEKVIEDQSKIKAIDLVRTLFLKNNLIQYLGKSVAIISSSQLEELPSYTYIKQENTGYTALDQKKKPILQLPQGTLVKLAEGRYMILDHSSLKNSTGLNRKLEDNTVVMIDKNQKVRLAQGKKTEEMASSDLAIYFETVPYKFDLAKERLVALNKKEQDINVRAIKVEIDDSVKGDKGWTASSSENSKKDSQTKESSSNSNTTSSSATSSDQSSSQNESSNQNNGTGAGNSAANNGGNGNGNGNSAGGGTGNNGANDANQKGATTGETNPDQDKINDIINQINETEENNDFSLPIVQVSAQKNGKSITGTVSVVDDSKRLRKLTATLLLDNKEIQSIPLNIKGSDQKIDFPKLKYGATYQLVVKGSYLYNDKKEQEVTFYRKNFTITPVTIEKKVVDKGSDYLVLDLKTKDLDGSIDKLQLKYKENNSLTSNYQTVVVDTSELTANGEVKVKITGLKSNTEYLIEMASLVVDGDDVTDSSWYLVDKTTKRLPSLASLKLEYQAAHSQFTVTPVGLKDVDQTIQSIRYVAYKVDEYAEKGKNATEYASAMMDANNKNSVLKIGRTANMKDGTYIFAAYISGNNGQTDYTLDPVISNSVEIGQKHKPTVQFRLKEATQDSLDISYEVFDQDETIIYNALSHPVFKVYKTDADGNIDQTVEPKVFDVKTPEELNKKLFVEGLKKETNYIVVLYASYDLENGEGIQPDAEIGRSEVFKTLAAPTVTAHFEQKSATIDSVKVNIKLSKEGEALQTAKIVIRDKETKTVVDERPLTSKNLKEMLTEDGSDFVLGDLRPNHDYTIEIANGFDTGHNAIPVEGLGVLKTKKRAPIATNVIFDYKEKDNTLGVLAVKEDKKTPISDEDYAVTKITYKIYDADELAKNPDAAPLAEKKVVGTIDEFTYFDLTNENLGRGRKYKVKAEIAWNDRFDDQLLKVESEEISIDRVKPEVEYQILSYDSSGIQLKLIVTDKDHTIVEHSLKVKNGSQEVAAEPDATVTVPVQAGGTTVTTSATYKLLSTGEKVTEDLQSKVFLPLNGDMPTISTSLTLKAQERKVAYGINATNNADKLIAVASKIYPKDQMDKPFYDSYVNGSDLSQAQDLDIPNEDADIWYNHSYEMQADTTSYYQENQMNNTTFAGYYNIVINNGSGYVASNKGDLSVSSQRNNASIYQIASAGTDSKGNISSVTFKNELTGKYLGFNGQNLADNVNAANKSQFTLVRQKDGSYVAKVNGNYVNFGSGLVGDTADASKFDLYSAAKTAEHTTKDLEIPALAEPTITGENLTVFDKKITINVQGQDADNVLQKDALNKVLLYVNVYRKDGAAPFRTVQVALPNLNVSVEDLKPDTEYTVKIEGRYDLLDGEGEQRKVFYTEDFKTESAVPSIDSALYTWHSSVYGKDAHTISTDLAITDDSKVLTDIEYRLYELTSDINYTDDISVMAPILEKLPAVALYNTVDKKSSLSIYKNSAKPELGQKFEAGKTYIIAAYLHTSLTKPGLDRFLGNVSKINITKVAPPTVNLNIDNVTARTADATFSYNDPQGYILTGNDKNFTYELTETATGKLADYVENYRGTFKGGQADTWLKAGDSQFKGLNPSTGYTLTIRSSYDDLDGKGARPWEIQKTFTTGNQYVTSNPLINAYNGNNLTLIVNNLNNGSATIRSIRFVLYRYNAVTNTVGTELMAADMPVSETYPINLNHQFDISSIKASNEYVMARLEVKYDTNLGETNQLYKVEAPVYFGGSVLRNTRSFSKVNVDADELQVKMPQELQKNETYQLQLQDEVGKVVKKQTISPKAMKQTVRVPVANKHFSTVVLLDQNQQEVARYQTNEWKNSVTAYKQNQQLLLKASDFKNTERLTVTKEPKKLTMMEKIQHFFGKDFKQTKTIQGKDLVKGYSLKVKSDEKVTVKQGNKEVNLQVVEVIK